MRKNLIALTVKFTTGAALAALLTIGLAPCAANAAVTTYHYGEIRSDGNVSSGVIGNGVAIPYYHSPFTFDFAVANALAANSTYNFGVNGVENGDSGNVLDLRASDGNALTTFTLADYHAHFDVYGGSVGHSLSRIHVQTDATGAISDFDINIQGRSALDAQYILNFRMQGTPGATGLGEALYYDPALFFASTVAGDVRCVIFCGGTFTSAAGGIGGAGGPGGGAGGVPEPASWALIIMGFGGLGAVLRRRRAAALAI